MSHELTFVNGTAQMFSVLETPWHQEGHVLTAAPSYDEAIALAGLGYLVEKVPTFIKVSDDDYIESQKAFVLRREDTRVELGSVGPDYTPVQNFEGFQVLKPLVDSGVAHLETGGSLREGADAWLMVRWDIARFGPIVREVFADQIIPFSTVLMNHSGRRGILLGHTPIRIVCANTLGAAEMSGTSRWVAVRHTGDAGARLIEAAETMFGGIIERYEVLARQYEMLKRTILTQDEFNRLVLSVVAPDPRKQSRFNPEARLAELVVARYERKATEVTRLWTEGKGHVGDHSAWEAYNGVVELLDHNTDLFPTRAGAFRTASLLDGRLSEMKNRVVDNLVELAEGSNG